jgi:phage protein D/phage baseplate assembly protein gpV
VTTSNTLVWDVPLISVKGTDLGDMQYRQLRSVLVERELRVPSRASLRFSDPEYQLSAGFPLDAEVVIKGPGKNLEATVLISGKITGLQFEQGASTPQLVVVLHDAAASLAQGSTVTTAEQMKVTDVVTKIARQHNLTAKVQATSEVLPYLLRVSSDLALLDVLADLVGYDWWVEGTTLHFHSPTHDPPATRALKLGDDLQRFDVRTSSLRPRSVTVRGWDPATKKEVVGNATAPTAGLLPSVKAPLSYASAEASAELFASGVAATSLAGATLTAQSLLNHLAAGAITATGTAEQGADIRVGGCVEVTSAGPTNGTYRVTKVEHVFKGTFETRFTSGARRPSSLVDSMRAAGPPALATLQHQGLMIGIVTKNSDDKHVGCVRVKFPALTSAEESGWARVLTLGGGSERGFVILPEINDEVLVAFEGGDLTRPVVLGGLYGGVDKMPAHTVNGGKVQSRRLTTRLGTVIELLDGDSPNTQHVKLELASKKNRILLSEDGSEIVVEAGKPLSIKVGDSSLVFDAQGSLSITALNVKIEAKGTFEVTSKGPATVESTASAELKGATVAVKAKSQLQLEGTAMATLKGGTVMIN